MIEIIENTALFAISADCFVNPANAKGWMGGWIAKHFKSHGIAEALQFESKGAIEKEAKIYCRTYKPKVGDLFTTNASSLPYKQIIHLITVRRPGWLSHEKTIETCLINLVNYCEKHHIESCVLTGIGTGTGRVPYQKVAELYKKHLTYSSTRFYVIDNKKEFLLLLQ